MSAPMAVARIPGSASTLARSLGLVLLAGVVLLLASEALGEYDDLQLANGAYYFAVLAGLTVLVGLSGQISLGHGALMAVGAYTVALLIGNEQWALVPALLAAVAVTTVVGIAVGAAAARLRGPYLAGATLAFAIGLPALADKYTSLFGGENGLVINPPTPPAGLGASFPLERWEAWIACAGALVVLFVMNNLVHSGVGRAFRAVRDDEIAASLCGLRVGRVQTRRLHPERRLRGARRGTADGGPAARRPRRVCAARCPSRCSRRSSSAGSARSSARSGARRCWSCCRAGQTTSPTRSRCRPRSRRTCRWRSTGSS